MRKTLLLAMSIGGLTMPLTACSDTQDTATVEPSYGPAPTLPAPEKSWLPTINVATATGWTAGDKPTAANGMAVKAFATGLDHPRTVYVLPNGDVLVAESNAPPKPDDGKGFKAWATKLFMSRAGARTPSANRITLLRDADGDGIAETRSVFISGLNSPFGMVLVGEDFYVADSDAILKFPYHTGDTKVSTQGVKLADLPARSITTGLRTLQPAQTAPNSMQPLGPTAMWARTASRPRKIVPPCWRSTAPAASGAYSPQAYAIQTARHGSRKVASFG